MIDENIIDRIKATLKEACEDDCDPCQLTTVNWLHDIGWIWIRIEGSKAKATFGFRIAETRLTIFNRPGMRSNHLTSSNELEAPPTPTKPGVP